MGGSSGAAPCRATMVATAASAADAEEPDFAADDAEEGDASVSGMAVDAGPEAPADYSVSDVGPPTAGAQATSPVAAAPPPALAQPAAAAGPVAEEPEREEEVMPWEGDGESWLEMLRDGFFRQMREEPHKC